MYCYFLTLQPSRITRKDCCSADCLLQFEFYSDMTISFIIFYKLRDFQQIVCTCLTLGKLFFYKTKTNSCYRFLHCMVKITVYLPLSCYACRVYACQPVKHINKAFDIYCISSFSFLWARDRKIQIYNYLWNYCGYCIFFTSLV